MVVFSNLVGFFPVLDGVCFFFRFAVVVVVAMRNLFRHPRHNPTVNDGYSLPWAGARRFPPHGMAAATADHPNLTNGDLTTNGHPCLGFPPVGGMQCLGFRSRQVFITRGISSQGKHPHGGTGKGGTESDGDNDSRRSIKPATSTATPTNGFWAPKRRKKRNGPSRRSPSPSWPASDVSGGTRSEPRKKAPCQEEAGLSQKEAEVLANDLDQLRTFDGKKPGRRGSQAAESSNS